MHTPRLQRELRTLRAMVEIHCHDRHGLEPVPCAECTQFLAYAERRLEKCPYGERKPTCARCPIHCYKASPRAMAQAVMRHAGPRMPLRHPLLSALHLIDQLRRVEHPMSTRRRHSG